MADEDEVVFEVEDDDTAPSGDGTETADESSATPTNDTPERELKWGNILGLVLTLVLVVLILSEWLAFYVGGVFEPLGIALISRYRAAGDSAAWLIGYDAFRFAASGWLLHMVYTWIRRR